MKASEPGERIRIDKWLWAARFFKTRSLAADAVSGGKVHLNGARTKPGKPISLGDQIMITRGYYEWRVIVRGLGSRRGPADEASLLYEETEESRLGRERLSHELRVQGPFDRGPKGRPTKKERRTIIRFTRGNG